MFLLLSFICIHTPFMYNRFVGQFLVTSELPLLILIQIEGTFRLGYLYSSVFSTIYIKCMIIVLAYRYDDAKKNTNKGISVY